MNNRLMTCFVAGALLMAVGCQPSDQVASPGGTVADANVNLVTLSFPKVS